jgi:hypothetical protein
MVGASRLGYLWRLSSGTSTSSSCMQGGAGTGSAGMMLDYHRHMAGVHTQCAAQQGSSSNKDSPSLAPSTLLTVSDMSSLHS